MELKDRKRINNRLPGFLDGFDMPDLRDRALPFPSPKSQLPIQKVAPLDVKKKPLILENTLPSSAAGIGPWFALGEWIGSGIGSGINAYLSSDDIISDAGTSTGYVNGMAYLRGNDIDIDQRRRDYNKQLGMSFLTNPFKGLAMAFGHKKQMQAIRDAARELDAVNTAAMAGASTDYLQQEYAKEHGNPLSLILYAKNGKDAVHTSEGEFDIAPNSKTEGGEIVYNQQNGTAHVIPGKADGDKNYSAVLPSDTILTNKYGIASRGRNAAKVLESLNKKRTNRGTLGNKTDELMRSLAAAILDDLAEEQKAYREAGMLPLPNNGKYRNGKFGRWFNRNSNWWIDGLGALSSVGNLISDAMLRVKRSNTHAENPYASNALNELASLRINPYPINKLLMDLQRRNLYAINHAGGLSGAQKAYSNVANGLAALNTIAASNADILKQNNAYGSAHATAALNAGQADRVAGIQTNQWDLDYYSKSHAGKQQMTQQDIYNALAALQQGYANSWKRYSFDRMMSAYDNSYA